MALILSLETSTKNCSVALSRDGTLLQRKEESSDQYIHSEKLHLFIEEVMAAQHLNFEDLDAVAVGKGPGSYTGLRIGVSAAKGLAYALGIPLIAVNGLQSLASAFVGTQQISEDAVILPMLDARRMEVYCAPFNHKAEQLGKIEARVVDAQSFQDLEAKEIYLLGDGAAKCKEVLSNEIFEWVDITYPSAATLGQLAAQKFEAHAFEDLAYFEPFYLKDFVAGKPKKLL